MGNDNRGAMSQAGGYANTATIIQEGNGNTLAGPVSANASLDYNAFQNGIGNTLTLTQTGDGNMLRFGQSGNNNTAIISQGPLN